MQYWLNLQGYTTNHPSVDAAMVACFDVFPKAHFSDWQETKYMTWMDVMDNSIQVGKITEVS
jgi:hypothetical protein